MAEKHLGNEEAFDPHGFVFPDQSHWLEIRAAYLVGQLGTVSSAADQMGVHRSTVIRRIDSLEAALGQKLFQRHNRGYTPTELGHALIRIAGKADENFSSFVNLTQAQDEVLSGELLVTCREIAGSVMIPLLGAFQEQNPKIQIIFSQINNKDLIDERYPRLELGESHISVRIGRYDEHPDYVYKYYKDIEFGLFASSEYAARFGVPDSLDDIRNHKFVCYIPPDYLKSGVHSWVPENIPEENIVFKSRSPVALDRAMLSGCGIGFYPLHLAENRTDLVKVFNVLPDWKAPIWITTHVDLRRGPKVKAFMDFLDKHR